MTNLGFYSNNQKEVKETNICFGICDFHKKNACHYAVTLKAVVAVVLYV